jgi:hypothetical protein
LPVIKTNILIFKGKDIPVNLMNAYGKVEVQLHFFLKGVVGHLGGPAILIQGKSFPVPTE